ncbi:MAG: hypothetical protein A2428_15855 [Bdellovibrionales bacterium RIFOXYC1_FULL_54_43]|nr:MAG: hypothetical protein A2428_15855 [Bdellovibrionales bacterium RIFOXYC1_FULL_54_43]OFZ85393.1 MAG: hypothetical protein A2603_00775 [Bdellovibrionales bacterium RIFOXYD1_FULL_55_31]
MSTTGTVGVAVSENAIDKAATRFPPGIPYIVGNEGAERFSFYGMRAILYIYLTSLYLQFAPELQVAPEMAASAKAHATQTVHLFMAGVYAFPMIGAILADRLLGKFNVILWVSLIYCAGHGVLAVAGRFGANGQYGAAELGMYLGLSLIAIGSGGIKPCVSANVGDQFNAENSGLVSKVYQIFYFIINFGSFFSTLLTPLLKKHFGAEVAFGVPGILMGIATIVFWMGRNKFTRVPPKPGGRLGLLDVLSSVLFFVPVAALIFGFFAGNEGSVSWTSFVPHVVISILAVALGVYVFLIRQARAPDAGFLAVSLHAIRHRHERKPGEGFFAPAAKKFGEEAAEGPPAVLRIVLVFSMVSVFWALFDQHSSTWIEQAKQMNLVLRVPEWGWSTIVAVTIGLALYGGTALLLWVSNIRLPKWLNRVVIGTAVAAVGITLTSDLVNSRFATLELQAAQIAALNPLMVMIIIPLLNFGVYGPLERRGIVIKPLRRMTIGMFLTAIAFACAAILQLQIEAAALTGGKVHVLWQVVQYFIMTSAEVLVSITGLEFAYTQAPRAMKSTIMGFWLLGVTFGNVLVAFLAPLEKTLSLSQFFWLFTVLMVLAAFTFTILARFYKGKTYLQAAKS